MNSIIKNNITIISSFINSFSENFDKQISSRILLSKSIFFDVYNMFINHKLNNIYDMEKFIFDKYHLEYNIAFISPKGVIFNSTRSSEINLNLFQFPEAKETLEKTKKTGKISIDFPVLDSSHKYFNIYILKFLKSKGYFLQLGYKIDILNKLMESFSIFKKINIITILSI